MNEEISRTHDVSQIRNDDRRTSDVRVGAREARARFEKER